ncbi:phosphoglycolate phosphatase [Falsiroseomonas oryzae]|uniref:phosphoglycolate phosphatase n=1 Tax=Falsiroseomonas oryzae TaxID=2766473 RepID=UPI0022EB1978|nr:phosphoglycolate phosphatase [Roseomonas sp. MO-31]
MTRLAVFDLDGTLVDSAPDIHAALDRMAAARSLPGYTRAEVLGMIGDGARMLVERALAARGQPFDPAAHDAFLADYGANATVETRLFPGIPEALARLESEGWRIAVCTNKPAAPARDLLASLGLLDRLAALAGGDSFAVRKPHPAHLLETVAAAGGTPAASVMIGDHHNDIRAARGAGIPCVFVGWGYGPLAMADGAPVAARPEALPAELGAALDGFRA